MFWIVCGFFRFIENLSKVLKTSSLNSTGMALGGKGWSIRRLLSDNKLWRCI